MTSLLHIIWLNPILALPSNGNLWNLDYCHQTTLAIKLCDTPSAIHFTWASTARCLSKFLAGWLDPKEVSSGSLPLTRMYRTFTMHWVSSSLHARFFFPFPVCFRWFIFNFAYRWNHGTKGTNCGLMPLENGRSLAMAAEDRSVRLPCWKAKVLESVHVRRKAGKQNRTPFLSACGKLGSDFTERTSLRTACVETGRRIDHIRPLTTLLWLPSQTDSFGRAAGVVGTIRSFCCPGPHAAWEAACVLPRYEVGRLFSWTTSCNMVVLCLQRMGLNHLHRRLSCPESAVQDPDPTWNRAAEIHDKCPQLFGRNSMLCFEEKFEAKKT